MIPWIDLLRIDLEKAEAIYEEKKLRAESLRHEIEWADQARADAGREVGRLRAEIESASVSHSDGAKTSKTVRRRRHGTHCGPHGSSTAE